MKTLPLLIVMLTVFNFSHADEADFKRTYKKTSSDSAEVLIETGSSMQAAELVDRAENQKFIDELLKDKNSKLAKLKAQIEMDSCGETSKSLEDSWIQGCGEVEITDYVLTSFGRGGWASAGAGYSFFIGFREDGTGHFFESSYIATFSEGVSAINDSDEDFKGNYLKTLSLDSITKLENASNEVK
jgi:hypothetical protein